MRLLVLATSLCLVGTALGGTPSVDAMVRKPTDIPAEDLRLALQTLARQRGFQFVYRADLVNGVRTPGAHGNLTTQEALTQLLRGTALTYGYLREKAVTIVRADGRAALAPRGDSANRQDSKDDEKAGRSFSGRFRMAQVAQGRNQGTGSALEAGNPADSQDARRAVALQTIMVTAQRVAQPENRVPISITAYSTATLNQRGIEGIDDIARQTPAITFSRDSLGRSQISIRGIASTVGAQTTGIYIDDTPIQVRNAGATSTDFYPVVFDLARVELLRGPQGTLFGAGSEGGTVRFITNQPDFSQYSVYARTAVSATENGSPSEEAGLAVGGPIADDVLAFRASAYLDSVGGYIDRVNPQTGATEEADSNWTNTDAETVSLAFRPASRLTLTASLFRQYMHTGNMSPTWWEQLSDPSADRYVTGNLLPSPDYDGFLLPSLRAEYDLSSVSVISSASYVYRHDTAYPDYSEYIHYLVTRNPYPTSADEYARGNFLDTQRYFTEETRVQSAVHGARFHWVAGLFYQDNKQSDEELISMPNFPEFFLAARGISYATFYGSPLGPGSSVYTDIEKVRDEQVAGFGQMDYRVIPSLTATAGVRVSHFNYSFTSQNFGPFAGTSTYGGIQSETAVAPRYSLAYQVTDRDMVYASAARGFRPGGAERVPTNLCDPDLRFLGIGKAPSTYDSDNVWSYEVGSKDTLAGGHLSLAGSLYYIKWRNIQQPVRLPDCGQSTILNLGSASSKGFDLSLRAVVVNGLMADLGVGYTNAVADKTIAIPGAANPLIVKGDSIGGPLFSPWQLTAGLEYDWQALDGRDAFVRADYQFHSRGPRPDPLLLGFDPKIPRTPSNSFVSLRLGMQLSDWEVSLFADNLLDSHVELQRSRQNATPIYDGLTFRPRTVGVRAIFRSN